MVSIGVAARDLQECLLIQLYRQKDEGKSVDIAIKAITKYFDEFTKKHYDKMALKLKIEEEELKEVVNEILKLNPKPGGSMLYLKTDAGRDEDLVPVGLQHVERFFIEKRQLFWVRGADGIVDHGIQL